MIVGTTILRLDGNPYYSPEFSRGGLAASFVLDVSHLTLTGAGKLSVTIEARNSEDTTWTSNTTFTDIDAVGVHPKDAVGVHPKDATGLKEIIRLKFEFTSTTTPTDAAHFLVQAPSWRPYA